MRVYIPAVSTDLRELLPPVRIGYCVVPHTVAVGEELELLEDDAQTEAGLASLSLLQDDDTSAPVRLILAVELSEGEVTPFEGDIAQIECSAYRWIDVVALFVDNLDAIPHVRAAVEATTQEEADDAVSTLWEESLEWYDIDEREALGQLLRPYEGTLRTS